MSQSPDVPDSVLDAALRLHRRGPSSVTMGAVAREAGISRATLYRHVEGREGLLEALVRTGRLAATEADPTRARVLGVALQVLSERGLAGFTMEAVAKAARVDASTLYRRFGSRARLLDTVVEELGARRFAWRLGTDPRRDPRDELRALTVRLLELGPRFGGLLRLALAAPKAERRRFQKLRRVNEGTETALTAWFTRLQDSGVLVPGDARLLAQSYLALVLHLGYFQPETGETPLLPVDRLADWVVDRFFDGATARSTEWGDR